MNTFLIVNMRGNSDVRRILNELNSNRLSIENDRRAYDKVRVEVIDVDVNISKVAEQWSSYCKKLTELVETVLCRSSDVNMFQVKMKVLDASCEKLGENIECYRHQLNLVRKELVTIAGNVLQQTMVFAKEWNCANSGRKYRRIQQSAKVSELSDFKKNLEYEMDNFLLMQRSVEYAEAEKLEIEKKFEKHKEEADRKEVVIREQLEIADRNLSNLNKKQEELANKDVWTNEFARISETIDNKRKSITFLESRVSETQRILENQRLEATSFDYTPFDNYFVNPVKKNSDKYQPPSKVRNVAHFTGPVEMKTSRSATFKSSDYSFNSQSKAPRMFQFKKKPTTSNKNPTLESVSDSPRNDVVPNSGFQNARIIFLSSNSESK